MYEPGGQRAQDPDLPAPDRDERHPILHRKDLDKCRATRPGSDQQVEARKREAWIAGKVYCIAAPIVNPRLVETGRALVTFSSVVFCEIEYSQYTLWQALRRVWRPGQTQKGKAVLASYNNAMEARTLAPMVQKMKAGQTLYGDEVGGAIVPEDEGDLLLKLAREALNKADIPDLQSLFAKNCQVGRPAIEGTELEKGAAPSDVATADSPADVVKSVTFDTWKVTFSQLFSSRPSVLNQFPLHPLTLRLIGRQPVYLAHLSTPLQQLLLRSIL